MSHNNCFTKKAEKILELVRTDGETLRDCQESCNIITRGLVRDLQHDREQMLEEEAAIKGLLPYFECMLMTMPGVEDMRHMFLHGQNHLPKDKQVLLELVQMRKQLLNLKLVHHLCVIREMKTNLYLI